MTGTTTTDQVDLKEEFKKRFLELPKVVQDAITSADVSQRLRTLAEGHKLHLDQWQVLENEVTLVLLGFDSIDNLAANLQKEVGVTEDVAKDLANNISEIVFAPVREELERALARPSVVAAAPATPTPTPEVPVRDAVTKDSAPAVAPGTPPTPVPDTVANRAPVVAESYHAAVPSHERRGADNDPYREQLG